jgi:hypothetical protein
MVGKRSKDYPMRLLIFVVCAGLFAAQIWALRAPAEDDPDHQKALIRGRAYISNLHENARLTKFE